MSTTAARAPEGSEAKRGALSGGALTDEVFDSSPTILRPSRGRKDTVAGLQQFFTPSEAADLVAAVNGRSLSTLDLTAGDGSLLAGIDVDFRFGVEIDADHLAAGGYEAIHGDVQHAYPLLRLLGTKFPRIACNPPFGLEWKPNGHRENSTVATWQMAMALLADDGTGAFIAGRDRFAREVMSRPDAAGIYALVELNDLFEKVELPCVIAFFVAPQNVDASREGGVLRISASREELPALAEIIRTERSQVAGYVGRPLRCCYRDSLVERFKTVDKELSRRRQAAASTRQGHDLALNGNLRHPPSPHSRRERERRLALALDTERLPASPPECRSRSARITERDGSPRVVLAPSTLCWQSAPAQPAGPRSRRGYRRHDL